MVRSRSKGRVLWLTNPEGKTTDWKTRALRAYQRRTLFADALIASCCLAVTNIRRVRRTLAALSAGWSARTR